MNLQAPATATQTNATDKKPYRIVIVGGGAGGLELATQLGNKFGLSGKAESVAEIHSLVFSACPHAAKYPCSRCAWTRCR